MVSVNKWHENDYPLCHIDHVLYMISIPLSPAHGGDLMQAAFLLRSNTGLTTSTVLSMAYML